VPTSAIDPVINVGRTDYRAVGLSGPNGLQRKVRNCAPEIGVQISFAELLVRPIRFNRLNLNDLTNEGASASDPYRSVSLLVGYVYEWPWPMARP
jgi:regulation of enolase protein 1 (concanavalin A-like superfamily)